jgi:hypothetical protein
MFIALLARILQWIGGYIMGKVVKSRNFKRAVRVSSAGARTERGMSVFLPASIPPSIPWA